MSRLKGDPGYRGGWCIHYRPSSDTVTTCEAGVEFSTLHGTKFETRPCFLTKTEDSKPLAAPCDKLRRPTPEEIAAHDAWSKVRQEGLFKAFAAIAEWRDDHRKRKAAGSTVVDCPACGAAKSLHVVIAARNGHTSGKCKTDGCVGWIE